MLRGTTFLFEKLGISSQIPLIGQPQTVNNIHYYSGRWLHEEVRENVATWQVNRRQNIS
jgi:hypothetical protein